MGVAAILFEKVREQIELTERLLDRVPEEQLDWRPGPPASGREPRSVGELLGHLLECLAGFCAVLHALDRARFARLEALRSLPVNHRCGVAEARSRIREYRGELEASFRTLGDDDLVRRVPTVFVPDGEAVLTLLLGNLEHLVNHKMELFFYLRLARVAVSSRDLYRFRGE
jgi:hypothetical protein